MKTHYILASLELPKPDERQKTAWWIDYPPKLKAHATKLNLSPHEQTILQLADSVWLIERNSGASFLVELLSAVKQCDLSYSIRFLDEES